MWYNRVISFFAALIGTQPAAATTTPQFYGPVFGVNKTDLDILARTMWGEARADGAIGMQAVANVVMNRYRLRQKGKGYPSFGSVRASVAEICQAPQQFSAWNRGDPNREKMLRVTKDDANFRTALRLAEMALKFQLADITGGADHYKTRAVSPPWAKGETPVRVVSSHLFYQISGVA